LVASSILTGAAWFEQIRDDSGIELREHTIVGACSPAAAARSLIVVSFDIFIEPSDGLGMGMEYRLAGTIPVALQWQHD
jgi:hypothetical protein